MRLREGREFFEGTENPKGKSAATVNEMAPGSESCGDSKLEKKGQSNIKAKRIASSGENCEVRFREPEGREKKKRSSLSLEGSEKW